LAGNDYVVFILESASKYDKLVIIRHHEDVVDDGGKARQASPSVVDLKLFSKQNQTKPFSRLQNTCYRQVSASCMTSRRSPGQNRDERR